MIIHRLHWGGPIHHVPHTLLEGRDILIGQTHPTTDEPPCRYNTGDAALDQQIAVLHALARVGRLPADAAERHINTYLLLHTTTQRPAGIPLRWFRMPLTDAPHHSLMPDLGQAVHQILVREPIACALSQVIEQCIPRFRHATRPIRFADSQPVLLMLVMGLLLGLYQGSVKKPGFQTRAILFARLRTLMTDSPERQTQFCARHEPVILLACMEYMARVLPAYMPAQFQAITTADPTAAAFYRRIPPLTDELRQWVDRDDTDGAPASWDEILEACAGRVDRVTRLKRNTAGAHSGGEERVVHHQPNPPRSHPSNTQRPPPSTMCVLECWNVPRVMSQATPDEFRMMGATLGLPGELIRQIQEDVQVYPLPANLRQIQIDRLRQRGRNRIRASHLQARWPICMHCVTTLKPSHATPPARLQMRLDTLAQELVCATCLGRQIVHVNMLGRILVYLKTAFYLCPACFTVQPYAGGLEQPWAPEPCCQHPASNATQPSPCKGGRRRNTCFTCGENALTHSLSRVDHLTGLMQEFHFCQRHAPRHEAARWCVNARQLAALDPKAPRQKRGY